MTTTDNLKASVSGKNLQGELEKILFKMNKEGNFKASLISDLDGLSLASAASEFDDRRISAISGIVQEVSDKAERYIGFKRVDEVSMVDDDKFRLVCREFKSEGWHLILTVMVPPYKTYRKLTNTALKDISKILKEMKKI
jgi:predicted regulator of Ras-like GTPase activity (Roadblock/LC7/MglB family)